MIRYYPFILMAALSAVTSCRSLPQGSACSEADEPVRITLGVPGTLSAPVNIHSGQMIAVDLCCPPLELCGADGKMLRQLKYTQQPQPLVAVPGEYSIVGYDPAGKKCVAKIRVTK